MKLRARSHLHRRRLAPGTVALLGVSMGLPLPPARDTQPQALSTPALEHVEVLRIHRDFGQARYLIALDGWVARTDLPQLAGLRLWWLDLARDDVRFPFEPWIHRAVEISYLDVSERRHTVTLRTDDLAFVFAVELDDSGQVRVHAPARTAQGSSARCEVRGARMLARRFLGVPTGVAEIRLRCRSPHGGSWRGVMVPTEHSCDKPVCGAG
ncbi:MAG: hypothetical protein B7733_18940 [Myxococcales bacterium FL481]|nr:MAG: hypothetical protein B7733_18940 [Myxococcales bacterium FL481]